MELSELLNNVNAIQVIGEFQKKDICSIEYDSRKVKANTIFIAIKGFKTDGHNFITDAINKGAAAIVLENNSIIPDEIFMHQNVLKILVKDSRVALAELSNALYNSPSEKLKLIGITGTNGKTTTSYYLKKILETEGHKVGLTGTIANYIGDEKIKSTLTTPESNDMNKLLSEMKSNGCDYSVMEVSSHALDLKRTHLLKYSAAVFTNITSEHLDFHDNFEAYLNSKKILFDSLTHPAFGVYNSDDTSYKDLIKNSKANFYSYGTTSNADFYITDIQYDLNGTSFNLNYDNNIYDVNTTLIGSFNAYNACAALAVSVLFGVSEETAIEGIAATKQIPGRFERVMIDNKNVFVDYSHTADSLEKALKVLRQISNNKNKIYTVFGCGGNRDRTKRPLMGAIASNLSDQVIITSDNPRDEEPLSIINEIKTGVKTNNTQVIEDRREAIIDAIESSEDDAIILIAGKGHENYQEINGERFHFSDKEIVESFINI